MHLCLLFVPVMLLKMAQVVYEGCITRPVTASSKTLSKDLKMATMPKPSPMGEYDGFKFFVETCPPEDDLFLSFLNQEPLDELE